MMAPPRVSLPSRLAENEINHPAPADVYLLRVAAVRQHVAAVAPRALQRVGQDRHRAEVTRLVHLPREGNRGGPPPRRSNATGRKGFGPTSSRASLRSFAV